LTAFFQTESSSFILTYFLEFMFIEKQNWDYHHFHCGRGISDWKFLGFFLWCDPTTYFSKPLELKKGFWNECTRWFFIFFSVKHIYFPRKMIQCHYGITHSIKE
jgi:hypothetical protein